MNIIVTGAGQGIGYELVKEFCRNLKVGKIIALSRNAENLVQSVSYTHLTLPTNREV